MNKLDRKIAPPAMPFGKLTLPPKRTIAFPNGARLHVVADTECPLVRVTVLASGGKCDFPNPAVSATAPMMVAEGSALFDTGLVADMLDYHGASFGGRCTDHHLRLDLTALASGMPALLPLLSDAIASPAVPDIRLNTVRGSLAAQCAYSMSRVANIASRKALSLMAGAGHPYAEHALPDDFAAVTREQVSARIASSMRAGGIDVILGGGADASIEDAVCEMLSALPAGDAAAQYITPFAPCEACTVRVDVKGAEQSAVNVTIPAVDRNHPDYIPLRLAVTALGGFFGSRLMQNIREDKGLTYGISASLNGVAEGGFVEISAECAHEYAERLTDELRSELLRMASVPLTADELLRMRLYEQTRLAAVLDNALATADYYATAIIVGMPDNYFENQEKITASINPDTIADISARYLRPELMRTVIAGE
ncbi:MAG: insulinase family protein [Muribaculaceae bacterium]|nr:insulinase family protein [Muribaculaceae bacterium]